MAQGADLVVFDLGGVLIRTAHSWEEAHGLAGLPGTPPEDPAFWRVLAELGPRQDGSISAATFRERIAAASSGRYTARDVERVVDAWLLGTYPGVDALFDALEAADVDTAVLSNTNEAHWARLAADGVDPAFPVVLRARHRFASHLLGLMKPDPAIYAVVVDRTGYAPARILLFDDRPENVDAAVAAGWQAVRVDPAGDPASQMRGALVRRGVVPPAGG